MAPAVLCGAQPGERILDLCAAPGGKSTKLAASLRGRGLLVANEIHPDRARVLSASIERRGVRNAVVTNETPQRLASRFPVFFDRIVVDAPCSGEGMFRKEEDALLNWSMENVYRCAARKDSGRSASMLRPQDPDLFDLCLCRRENEAVIFHFLEIIRNSMWKSFQICPVWIWKNGDLRGIGLSVARQEFQKFRYEMSSDGGLAGSRKISPVAEAEPWPF